MTVNVGIFGGGTNFEDRLITDKRRLDRIVKFLRAENRSIVLTSGTWDLVHLGHLEYLERAKELGDFLIVGVDADAKVRQRKGPKRPVVPQKERMHILAHARHVDALMLKHSRDPKHDLLKRVRPDVLVISKTSGHEDGSIKEMEKYCGEVVLLEPQAETSTSARVRLLHTSGGKDLLKRIRPRIHQVLEEEFKKFLAGDV